MYSKFIDALYDVFVYLMQTMAHNWFVLTFGIVVAVAITVYIDIQKVRKRFLRRPRFLILGSVAFGAFTPFCACGTMAVVLSFITTAFPWGATMAFLVSSPLMSPDMFIMLSGFMGLQFAVALTISSILLGIGAGWICNMLEAHTHFLDNQLRQSDPKSKESCGECSEIKLANSETVGAQLTPCVVGLVSEISDKNKIVACNCNTTGLLDVHGNKSSMVYRDATSSFYSKVVSISRKMKVREFVVSFFNLGIKKVLPLFLLFVVIAYLVKVYVPTEWIVTLFSGAHFYSIPLAALIGLPMYVSDATVLPLLQVLRDGGASEGALLAYMISGPATSIGVIGGLSFIIKRRVIILYILIILIGAIALGFGYDLISSFIV